MEQEMLGLITLHLRVVLLLTQLMIVLHSFQVLETDMLNLVEHTVL